MLLLHTTTKIIAFVLCATIVFASCSSTSKKNTEVIRALNESVESSNKLLSIATMDVMIALKNKMGEPATIEKAKVWYPKGERVQYLSKDVYDYIENLKKGNPNIRPKNPELFERLKKYQREILEVDQRVTDQFEKSMKIFTGSIDSSKLDQKKIFQDYFKNMSAESALAMLSKLQNNLKVNELRMVTFCNEQVGVTSDYWPVFQSIAILNTTLVQPKELIELTAGMLSFQRHPKSEVFVYNKKVELIEDGFAHFRFRAPAKTGKYNVPVKVNYINLDGSKESIEMKVGYTVANIQKQE